MFLRTWKGLAIIGLIAALVVSGVGIHAFSSEGVSEVGDAASTEPEVEIVESVSEDGIDTLTVRVGVRVEGKAIPIGGVALEIFSVDVVRENNIITITLEKVAEGETDEAGTAAFDLEHGKYLVVAHYKGLMGFGKCNMEEDTHIDMLLHNWSSNCYQWQNNMQHAYKHMTKMTMQIELEEVEVAVE